MGSVGEDKIKVTTDMKGEVPQQPRLVLTGPIPGISQPSTSSVQSTRLPPSPRSNSQRPRSLNDERCEQFVRNLLLNGELQSKVMQIQNLRAQMDYLRDQRIHNYGQTGYEAGDFMQSPIVVEPEDSEVSLNKGQDDDVAPPASNQTGDVTITTMQESSSALSVPQSVLEWSENGFEGTLPLVWDFYTGTCLMKDIAFGNVAGYLTACFVQKYGKSFLCSLAGGLLLLKLAHLKGYICVDWSKVKNEIESSSIPVEEDTEDFENIPKSWILSKIQNTGKWAKANSYTAVGFACGFAFKSFSSY